MRFLTLKYTKGSHVGMMVSFTIFILFVVFAYVILRPIILTDSKENLLEFVKNALVDELSADVKVGSIAVTGAGDCVQLNNFFADNGFGHNLLLTDADGNAITASGNGAGMTHLRINAFENSFFRVYESDEFAELEAADPCDHFDYRIGAVKTETFVFESKVSALISEYSSDYGGLKQRLAIPSDFGFSFFDSLGGESSTNEQSPSRAVVYAGDFPVQYFSTDGEMKIGKLNVRVWG